MSPLPPPVAAFVAALAPAGINVHGVASAADWDAVAAPARTTDALLPGTRSILVLGNGGPALWRAFVADLQAHPEHLATEANPLDAFVHRALLAADPLLGDLPRRWFRAANEETTHLDFRVLARLAGLGAAGRLGLLMHPEHGPWLGLRAACLLPVDLPPSPVVTTSPCDSCPAPCVAACPGGAFGSGTWSVDACGAFKLSSAVCEGTCHARLACPAGATSRYPTEALRYHSHRASGRRWLREQVGLVDDPYEGDGPYWGDWRSRVNVQR
jgi:hypothetical protein